MNSIDTNVFAYAFDSDGADYDCVKVINPFA
jgi:predicted nucleic acid-binding protein